MATHGSATTVADVLLARLRELGVGHIFGVPGDYILPLFRQMAASGIAHVATCNELDAGYAADGYARLEGLGAVAVTCGPGALSLVNAVAGAYAERIPVVVLAGGPPARDYRRQPARHHMLPGKYGSSVRIFSEITELAQVLTDSATAVATIDRGLQLALDARRPVYLELPTDVQTAPSSPPAPFAVPPRRAGDARAMAELVNEITARVRGGGRTVLLPGHEVHSFGLGAKLRALVEQTGLPVASLLIGKATYLEDLPQCIGTYQGAGTQAAVRAYVEGARTLLFLGAVDSDFNLGGGTAGLGEEQAIWVFDGQARYAGRVVDGIDLAGLIDALRDALPVDARPADSRPVQQFLHRRGADYAPDAGARITSQRFYDRLAGFLASGDIVLGDAGCAVELAHTQFPAQARFVASLYWASIGMGFGATLGACFATPAGTRVVAVEGDGSFQMTAQELSTMVRYDLRPVVFLVNNRGFTAERLIHDGPFNDVAEWKYHELPQVFGGVRGVEVFTEGDLERALEAATAHRGPGPLLIEVHIDPLDASEVFRLMSERLRSG